MSESPYAEARFPTVLGTLYGSDNGASPANPVSVQKLTTALAAAPEEPPPPPVPCPACQVRLGRCRRCVARARWRSFVGTTCRICHRVPARGGSGQCRRCYERQWTRRWVRARRLATVCKALAGMPFNPLLQGVQSRNPTALQAVQRLLEAVAEGRGWIARSPWPARRRHQMAEQQSHA